MAANKSVVTMALATYKSLAIGVAAAAVILTMASCDNSTVDTVSCASETEILETITDVDGTKYIIAADGNVYKVVGSSCEFFQKYFDLNFESDNYEHQGASVFIKSSDGLVPTRNVFLEDFQRYNEINELFMRSGADTDRYWNTMTLQSPLAPTIPEYNALKECILNKTCTFRDNRIDFDLDPLNPVNRVLKFTAVSPSASMITSKSSIANSISYFGKGSELWYEAKYFFTDNLPFSIVDFETQWFEGSPGPRVVISGGALAIENKFGPKIFSRQTNPIPVPKGSWVTVKVHFVFDETSGHVELWQNGALLLDVHAPTLPLYNAIQTNIEVGISSTSSNCVLYVDDVRLSNTPF